MAIHSNRNKVVSAIAARQDFKNAKSLTGELRKSPLGIGSGQMPWEAKEEFQEAMKRADYLRRDVYVVKSYDTPIGYHVAGEGWTIPDAKYSSTTSNHQGLLRQAVL